MTVNSSSQRNLLVQSLLAGGRYGSEEEVIDEALRLLVERDAKAKPDELRNAIALGVEDADRGDLAPFDPKATLERIRSGQARGDGQS